MAGYVQIESNAEVLAHALGDVFGEQIPYATAKALTEVAFGVQRAEKSAMAEALTLRNKFSQSGVQVNRAEKDDWPATYAEVGIEERRSYLIDHVLGGKREGGRHGRAILEAEEMRSKSGRVPGGKRPGALIERAMRAKRQAELNSAFGARSRKKDKRLPFLIYSRKWGNEVLVRRDGPDRYPLEIVYAFKRGVSIKRTFEMELVAQREVAVSYYHAFDKALRRAIASGKSKAERRASDSSGGVIESGR